MLWDREGAGPGPSAQWEARRGAEERAERESRVGEEEDTSKGDAGYMWWVEQTHQNTHAGDPAAASGDRVRGGALEREGAAARGRGRGVRLPLGEKEEQGGAATMPADTEH